MSTEPERFFCPPTSASGTFSSWVGVFLDLSGDDEVDWREVAAIIEEAYRLVAAKELSARAGCHVSARRRGRAGIHRAPGAGWC